MGPRRLRPMIVGVPLEPGVGGMGGEYDIDAETLAKPGFIEIPDALGEPEFSMYPLKNYGTIDLEPGTDSAFTAYAALPPGGVYVVRWTILQKANEDPYSWDSEALLDLSAVDGT